MKKSPCQKCCKPTQARRGLCLPCKRANPLVRFWPKVRKTAECWFWTGAIQERGYGQFWIKGNVIEYAHRYSYEAHKGAIPEGMVVMHACDTPSCVNPEHLSLGTNHENSKDAQRKGRINTVTRRISPEVKREAIRRALSGERRVDTIARFGMSERVLRKWLADHRVLARAAKESVR